MDKMIKQNGFIMAFGHKCADVDTDTRGCIVTYDEPDAKQKHVPFDAVSWVSPDWFNKD